MTTSITAFAVALVMLLGAAHGVAAQTSTDTGSTPTAVTPTPSTGADTSIRGGDTLSKPENTIESPSTSPRLPSQGRDGAASSTKPDAGGTGSLGTGTYGAPPYGLGSTPPSK
jgi:hypothetical protein